MANLNPISLENKWTYFPTDKYDPTNPHSWEDAASWGWLASLADWPPDKEFPFSIQLDSAFYLQPMNDICVRYVLHINTAPEGTKVSINGWDAGIVQAGQPFTADVTDFVTLDNNGIRLVVKKSGALQGVMLQPVPCEET